MGRRGFFDQHSLGFYLEEQIMADVTKARKRKGQNTFNPRKFKISQRNSQDETSIN